MAICYSQLWHPYMDQIKNKQAKLYLMVDSTEHGVKYIYITIVHLLLNWMSEIPGCFCFLSLSVKIQLE